LKATNSAIGAANLRIYLNSRKLKKSEELGFIHLLTSLSLSTSLTSAMKLLRSKSSSVSIETTLLFPSPRLLALLSEIEK
jgi:hypothetical protein